MHSHGSADGLGAQDGRSDAEVALTRLEQQLPPLLSVIAGMVDLTGFYTLGNIFTAHVTGNLVVGAAALVGSGPLKLAQVVAIPVFMLALAGVWLLARISGYGPVALVRLFLWVQFILLAAVLVVGVTTKASTDPRGLMAGTAAMIAVAAMASQYALLRLALPRVVSTAVMTGNLTNFVLTSMTLLWGIPSGSAQPRSRWAQSVLLLLGFLLGCAVAGAAVRMFADWAWVGPVVLAAALIVAFA